MNRTILICTLCALVFVPAGAAKRRVFTIGDSTMSEYQPAATPKRGWAMYLQAFFNPDSVEVVNRGKSGASTRTFYETPSLWPSVKEQFRQGDYLIIQFAHNDEKCKGEDVYVTNRELLEAGKDTLTDMRGTEPNTTYKEYLFKFINEARGYGVTPVMMGPICRAYFTKDGTIGDEGRHKLQGTKELDRKEAAKVLTSKGTYDKDYVRCMREVAEDMWVPFLDMTAASQELYERQGKAYCMEHYFSCGDKTHTAAEGGMAIATLAYNLIQQEPLLADMQSWMVFPSKEEYQVYARRIEEKGRQAALTAKGGHGTSTIKRPKLVNMQEFKGKGYAPQGGWWPAGEIDEVQSRYLEYSVFMPSKKGAVVEQIELPVQAIGGNGMNIHINYGFGNEFKGVTTIYENTALRKNKKLTICLREPIIVPSGERLIIRVLPWYDSNGKPQKGKYLHVETMTVSFKTLH